MITRPAIFISAVSKELRSARDLIAKTLQVLGYEPVWQDIFGTEQGDLRAVLRKKIDKSQGVLQIVGQCYGAEPTAPDGQFGRVSYTQYEALYAKNRQKKVWYFVLDDSFPTDSHENEPENMRSIQTAYRQRILDGSDLFHHVSSGDELKVKVHELRNEFARLWRPFMLLASAQIALLLAIASLLVWLSIILFPSKERIENRANAAFIAKDYPTAFDLYAQLSNADPDNIDFHRRIQECTDLGRLQKAFLDRYVALVRTHPDNAVFNNYLGNAYLALDPKDKDGKAREHYQTALRLDPKLSSPLANLGILMHREGRPDEAESFFKRYLAAEPNDAQGWVNLGLLYVAKTEAKVTDTLTVSNAENAFRKALEIDPASAPAYKGLGRLLSFVGSKPEALDAFQRSYALDDSQPDVRQQIELLAWGMSDSRVTVSTADDLKTRGQNGNDATTQAAEAPNTGPIVVVVMKLLDQGRYQEAEAKCLEWTKTEPDNPIAWRLMGRSYQMLNRTDDSQRAFDKAMRLASSGGNN